MTLERFTKNDWHSVLIALSIFCIILYLIISQIREHYLQDDPMLQKLKIMLAPLDPAVKNLKLYKGKKSYTINKQKIYICLKDEHGEYYPDNSLIFVCVHEIAHLLNKEDVGHTPAFHAKFQELLDKATRMGIYDPSKPIDENYCKYND